MKHKNEPAFPFESDPSKEICNGLTKREYFSGLAMQGMLASMKRNGWDATPEFIEHVCNGAVKYADELLKQLNQQP